MICFSIANKCNWDCEYCISQGHNPDTIKKNKPNPK